MVNFLSGNGIMRLVDGSAVSLAVLAESPVHTVLGRFDISGVNIAKISRSSCADELIEISTDYSTTILHPDATIALDRGEVNCVKRLSLDDEVRMPNQEIPPWAKSCIAGMFYGGKCILDNRARAYSDYRLSIDDENNDKRKFKEEFLKKVFADSFIIDHASLYLDFKHKKFGRASKSVFFDKKFINKYFLSFIYLDCGSIDKGAIVFDLSHLTHYQYYFFIDNIGLEYATMQPRKVIVYGESAEKLKSWIKKLIPPHLSGLGDYAYTDYLSQDISKMTCRINKLEYVKCKELYDIELKDQGDWIIYNGVYVKDE